MFVTWGNPWFPHEPPPSSRYRAWTASGLPAGKAGLRPSTVARGRDVSGTTSGRTSENVRPISSFEQLGRVARPQPAGGVPVRAAALPTEEQAPQPERHEQHPSRTLCSPLPVVLEEEAEVPAQ